MRMTTNRQRQRKIFIVMMMVKKFTTMMGSSKRIIVTVMERPQHNATMHDTRAATLKLDIVCRLELPPSWLTEVSG